MSETIPKKRGRKPKIQEPVVVTKEVIAKFEDTEENDVDADEDIDNEDDDFEEKPKTNKKSVIHNEDDEMDDEELEDNDEFADDDDEIDIENAVVEEQELDTTFNVKSRTIHKEKVILKGNMRKTIPIMTKYEETKVIAFRAEAIQNGAMPLIEHSKSMSYEEIAMEELRMNKCPLIIYRPLPYNHLDKEYFEEFKVSELKCYSNVMIHEYF